MGVCKKTGTNEAWQAKNIYDLAGNVVEWTIESSCGEDTLDTGDELVRVLRGGSCISSDDYMSGSLRISRKTTASIDGFSDSSHETT